MNLNTNQIKKIQKKVGKKVDKKIEEREREEREERVRNFKFIRKVILGIQNKNPDSGPCLCVWKGRVFGLNPNTNRVEPARGVTEDALSYQTELMEIKGDKKFFMSSKEEYQETLKVMDWMSEHYADIRLAVANMNDPSKGFSKLVNSYSLGIIFEKFQKEFPLKTMADFIEAIKVMDNLIKSPPK